MKKLLMALMMISPMAMADYLVKTDGTVINIPEGGNGCAFHPDYNPKGFNEEGKYPSVAIGNAIRDKLDLCANITDFPSEEECIGLVLSPSIRDPRCAVYDD